MKKIWTDDAWDDYLFIKHFNNKILFVNSKLSKQCFIIRFISSFLL